MSVELYATGALAIMLLAYGVWIVWWSVVTRRRKDEAITLVTVRRDARRTRVGLRLAFVLNVVVIAHSILIGVYGLITLVSFAAIGIVVHSLRLNSQTLREVDAMQKKAPGDR